MITQRAVLFGFVGFCFYLIAIVNALPPFYYSLTWLTAGILVSCFGVALLSLFALQCEWSVPGSVVSEWLGHDQTKIHAPDADSGDSSPDRETPAGAPGIEIDIANAGTLNKTDIVLEVCLREVRCEEELTRRFLIEALPSGGRLRTRLPLHDLPRGRYRVEEMRLVGSDVLGLFRLRKRVPSRAEASSGASATDNVVVVEGQNTQPADITRDIVVGPAMIVAPEARAWLQTGGVSGGMDATATLGQGDEVRGTRPYHAGDDLRFVHWKTTARRGELVVREFHRTARNQCVVVWDGALDAATALTPDPTSTSSPTGIFGQTAASTPIALALNRFRANPRPKSAQRAPQDAVEFGLRLTASLCRTLTESGQPCALLRLDGNPLMIRAVEQGAAASSMLSRVSEALADAHASRPTSLTQSLARWMREMAPGNGLYIVTATPTPDLVTAIQMLRTQRSNVSVCIIDTAALAAMAAGPTSSRSPQSTLARSDSQGSGTPRGSEQSPVQAIAQIEALRAAGVSVVTAPHREALEALLPAAGTLSAADRRGDQEVAAIRTALRELLQGSAQGPHGGAASGIPRGIGNSAKAGPGNLATASSVEGNQVAAG
ncbi:MAG: hypothetical protein JWN98_2141 [Abditibacteriota bacterium]|nr:hypothetical protein [Abditibacteriota bacterium]